MKPFLFLLTVLTLCMFGGCTHSDEYAKIRRDIPTLTTMLRTQKPGQPDAMRLCSSLVKRILAMNDRTEQVELLSDLQNAIFAIRLEGVPRLCQYACLRTVLDMNHSTEDILHAMYLLHLPHSNRYRFMIRNLEWYQAQLSEFAKGAEADTPPTQEEMAYRFGHKGMYESRLFGLKTAKELLVNDFHFRATKFPEKEEREIQTMIESYLGHKIKSARECEADEERDRKKRREEELSRRKNHPQRPPQKFERAPKTPTPEERMQTFQIDVDL